jgi:hypothetical protein
MSGHALESAADHRMAELCKKLTAGGSAHGAW